VDFVDGNSKRLGLKGKTSRALHTWARGTGYTST